MYFPLPLVEPACASSPLSLFFPILSLSRSAFPLDLFSRISCPGPQKLQVLLQWDLELQLQGLDLDLLLGTLLMYLLMVQD